MTNIIFVKKQHKQKFNIKGYIQGIFLICSLTSFLGDYTFKLPGICIFNNRLKKQQFIVNTTIAKIFKNIMLKVINILCFCWSSSFELIGYNFDLQKKIKKNILKFSVGLSKHKVLVCFDPSIRIFGQKRYFSLFSTSISNYYKIINFLLNLRNIFPYKKRGIVPAIIPSIWMKPGKKTKYK